MLHKIRIHSTFTAHINFFFLLLSFTPLAPTEQLRNKSKAISISIFSLIKLSLAFLGCCGWALCAVNAIMIDLPFKVLSSSSRSKVIPSEVNIYIILSATNTFYAD